MVSVTHRTHSTWKGACPIMQLDIFINGKYTLGHESKFNYKSSGDGFTNEHNAVRGNSRGCKCLFVGCRSKSKNSWSMRSSMIKFYPIFILSLMPRSAKLRLIKGQVNDKF